MAFSNINRSSQAEFFQPQGGNANQRQAVAGPPETCTGEGTTPGMDPPAPGEPINRGPNPQTELVVEICQKRCTHNSQG